MESLDTELAEGILSGMMSRFPALHKQWNVRYSTGQINVSELKLIQKISENKRQLAFSN